MIRGDDPIAQLDEDLLGRASLASVISGEIRDIDAATGFVVGVLGSWGSGKTSIINLIAQELAKEPSLRVIFFNPWMFSGADQLVERFFDELGGQLGKDPDRFGDVVAKLAPYGKLVAPLKALPIPYAGTLVDVIQSALESAKEIAEERKSLVTERRRDLEDSLKLLERPFVVVIDDIDRLTPSEIRDIFKLVRLTASFPKVIYVVAFDRARVEEALSEKGLSGREYLEKIIQLNFDIPAIPQSRLSEQIISTINEVLDSDMDKLVSDPKRWIDIYWETVFPLFKSMRDVRRYAASLRGTARSLDRKMSLEDLLALEAVRVFMPDVFAQIIQSQDALTGIKGMPWEQSAEDRRKGQLDSMLLSAGERKHVVESLIDRVFPIAARHIHFGERSSSVEDKWLRERRAAHPAVLAYYLERVSGRQLEGMWDAEKILPMLGDQGQIENYFKNREPAVWVHIFESLSTFATDVPPEAVVPTLAAVLDILAEHGEPPRNHFEPSALVAARRLIAYLIYGQISSGDSDDFIKEAIARITHLWGKHELVAMLSDSGSWGFPQIVSPDLIDELGTALRSQIREASEETMKAERNPLLLLDWAAQTSGDNQTLFPLPTNTELDCVLLKGALHEDASRTGGSRAISIVPRLDWRALKLLFGGEENIRQVLERCRATTSGQSFEDAFSLAEQYLAGYRPSSEPGT